MKAHWLYRLVTDIWDEELSPELIDQVQAGPADKALEFRSLLADLLLGTEIPPIGAGEVRPYISPAHALGRSWHGSGIANDPGEDPDGFPRHSTAVLHCLLYCHRVVVPIPENVFSAPTKVVAARTARFLAMVSELRPLVESDYVILVRRPLALATMAERFASAEREMAIALAGIDFSDYAADHAKQGWPPLPRPHNRELYRWAEKALNPVEETFALNRSSKNAGQLFLPYRFQAEAVRRLLAAGIQQGRAVPEVPQRELVVMRQILACQLPLLAFPTASDFVRVRENEEVFAGWRGTLRQVLLSSKDSLLPKRLALDVREELLSSQSRIEAVLDDSRFLSLDPPIGFERSP